MTVLETNVAGSKPKTDSYTKNKKNSIPIFQFNNQRIVKVAILA